MSLRQLAQSLREALDQFIHYPSPETRTPLEEMIDTWHKRTYEADRQTERGARATTGNKQIAQTEVVSMYLVIYLDDGEFETLDMFETLELARRHARDLIDQGHTNIKIAKLLPDE